MSLLHDATLARWAELDRRWALAMHRWSTRPWTLGVLVAASRLGDGLLWYAIAGGMFIFGGASAAACALLMLGLAALNLLIYWWLKRRFARPRPYAQCADFRACTRALDQFSFPSGHSLHAVSFAIVLSTHYPSWGSLAWIAVALIAASRVVLGLHYPSDVVVGAGIGAVTASLAVLLLGM